MDSFVSLTPLEEGFPRTTEDGLYLRESRNWGEELPGFYALPVTGTQSDLLSGLCLGNPRLLAQGHDIPSESGTATAGRWHLGRHSLDHRVNRNLENEALPRVIAGVKN